MRSAAARAAVRFAVRAADVDAANRGRLAAIGRTMRTRTPPVRIGEPLQWHRCLLQGFITAGDRQSFGSVPSVRQLLPTPQRLGRPAIFPLSNELDAGALGSQGFSCVQRPHNLRTNTELLARCLPTTAREKAPFTNSRLVNARAISPSGWGRAIRERLNLCRGFRRRRSHPARRRVRFDAACTGTPPSIARDAGQKKGSHGTHFHAT